MTTTLIIQVCIMVAVAFLFGFISAMVISSRKTPTKSTGPMLDFIVSGACEVAEKMFTAKGSGAQKLDFAMDYIRIECSNYNIDFDPTSVNELINVFVANTFNPERKQDDTSIS